MQAEATVLDDYGLQVSNREVLEPGKGPFTRSTALTFLTVQPISCSRLHRNVVLESATFPESISSPTTTSPATQLMLLCTPDMPPDGRLSLRRC
jgi:hypothetical protein